MPHRRSDADNIALESAFVCVCASASALMIAHLTCERPTCGVGSWFIFSFFFSSVHISTNGECMENFLDIGHDAFDTHTVFLMNCEANVLRSTAMQLSWIYGLAMRDGWIDGSNAWWAVGKCISHSEDTDLAFYRFRDRHGSICVDEQGKFAIKPFFRSRNPNNRFSCGQMKCGIGVGI